MAPNIHFDLRRLHQDDEELLVSAENTLKLSESNILVGKEGRQLWEQMKCSKTVVYDDDNNNNSAIRKALSSIRILSNRSENQDWLDSCDGDLYDVPVKVLENLASLAPRKFAARVADFNDNLFYEMQTQRGLSHLGLGVVQDMLGANEYLGSFLSTESSVPQPAHVDYAWEVLEGECGQNLQLGFFPLTKEGMLLQVWPRNDDKTQMVEGEVVFVPFGKLMLLPAKTIHGGGFRTTLDQKVDGNLRFHLYMARESTKLPTHQTNKYTEPSDKTKELSRRYVDSPSMSDLLNYLFV